MAAHINKGWQVKQSLCFASELYQSYLAGQRHVIQRSISLPTGVDSIDISLNEFIDVCEWLIALYGKKTLQ